MNTPMNIGKAVSSYCMSDVKTNMNILCFVFTHSDSTALSCDMKLLHGRCFGIMK